MRPAGVELCSGVLAVSSSASLLRLRLKRLLCRVSGLGRLSGVDRGNPIFGRNRLRGEKTLALLEFLAWCGVSEGNQVGTIASKLAAVLHYHRVDAQTELPTSAPLIKRALNGVARSHVAAGTPKRVRRPISWDTLLEGQCLAPSWGQGGRVLWTCLALGYFFVARSDEIFASATGVVHSPRRPGWSIPSIL